jgi:hypothetical protein
VEVTEVQPMRAPAGAGCTVRTSAGAVALLVLLAGTAFVGARLWVHGGDASAFVAAGDEVTRPAEAPELTVRHDDLGYDGQFFHRLARNPFSRQAREFGTRLDRPAYRQQRIGYPLVTWALTGGRAPLVPWALIGVNLASLGVLALLAARLSLDAERPAWWGLVAAAWPGLLVALAYDLSEVLAGTLLLAVLLALRRRSWIWATLALTAAGLTRETTLVLAAGLLIAGIASSRVGDRRGVRHLLGNRPATAPVWVGVVPIAVAGLFRVALTAWWSGVPDTGPAIPSFVGVPFLPLLRQLGDWVTTSSSRCSCSWPWWSRSPGRSPTRTPANHTNGWRWWAPSSSCRCCRCGIGASSSCDGPTKPC